MKKLNITTGPLKSVANSRNQSAIRDTNDDRAIAYIPELHPDSEGNTALIIDAFKVAVEFGYTPSMLIDERRSLLQNAKETHEAMCKIIKAPIDVVELLSIIKDARERLIVHNSDALGGELGENCKDYQFIQLLGTLVTNP